MIGENNRQCLFPGGIPKRVAGLYDVLERNGMPDQMPLSQLSG